MNARFFVDTEILVYAHDASTGARYERARALLEEPWQSRSGVVSTQVLQELCVHVQKKMARPLDIEARFRVSFWDALIIQAAQAAGAEILYSEDLSDGQRYGDLRVVNPLGG